MATQADMVWPPDMAGELTRRAKIMELLARAQVEAPERFDKAMDVYRRDPVAFVEDFCVFVEPRNANKGLPVKIPVVPFPKQIEIIRWLHERYRSRTSAPCEKSRDSGLTYIACAFSVWLWLFVPGAQIGWGSRKEMLVHRQGDPSSIFEKIRGIIDHLPAFMLPEGFNAKENLNYMKFVNPETGAAITGEAGNNIGRGGRTSITFIDESAFLENEEAVTASLSANTDVRIDISSVRAGTLFGDWCKASPHKLRIETTEIPWHTPEWLKEKRLELESKGMGHLYRQEFLLDATAGIAGQLINSEWIEAAIDAVKKLKMEPRGDIVAALDVADAGQDKSAVSIRWGVHLSDAKTLGHELRADQAAREGWGFVMGFNGCATLLFDSIGVGAGAAGAFRTIKENRVAEGLPPGPDCIGWAASSAVIDPDKEFVNGRTNADMFANRAAQAWWHIRMRFEAVYRKIRSLDPSLSDDERAALNADHISLDDIISLSSKIAELGQLKSELAQITYSHNSAGKIVIDKKPKGHKSPNLADAAMMAFSPTKAIDRRSPAFGFVNIGGELATKPPRTENEERPVAGIVRQDEGPRPMRDLIVSELALSREIISGGTELVPRFRIGTPDGDTLIFVQLPDDLNERTRRMSLVSSYMAVHMAQWFIMATELQEPDASSAVAVTRQGCDAGIQMISRSPLSFGETIWLDPSQIGDDLPAMLPRKVEAVTPEQVAEVDRLIAHSEGLIVQRNT